MNEGLLVPQNSIPIQLEGEFWKCVLLRSVRAIAAGGPFNLQVIELHGFRYEFYRPPIEVSIDPALNDLPNMVPTLSDRVIFPPVNRQPLKIGW